MGEHIDPQQQVAATFDFIQRLRRGEPVSQSSTFAREAFDLCKDVMRLDPLSTVIVAGAITNELNALFIEQGIMSSDDIRESNGHLSESINAIKVALFKASPHFVEYAREVENIGKGIATRLFSGKQAPMVEFLQTQAGMVAHAETILPSQMLARVNELGVEIVEALSSTLQ